MWGGGGGGESADTLMCVTNYIFRSPNSNFHISKFTNSYAFIFKSAFETVLT